jgi:hypothetical protein
MYKLFLLKLHDIYIVKKLLFLQLLSVQSPLPQVRSPSAQVTLRSGHVGAGIGSWFGTQYSSGLFATSCSESGVYSQREIVSLFGPMRATL